MRFSSKRACSTPFTEHKTKRAIEHFDMQSSKVKPRTDEAMLLGKMQRRMASNLQIVASILSLKARTADALRRDGVRRQ